VGQIIVDRTSDLKNWVEIFREFVAKKMKIFAYANNHYAGHGPATVKTLWGLVELKTEEVKI